MAARKKAKRAGRKASARGSNKQTLSLESLRSDFQAMRDEIVHVVRLVETVAEIVPLLEEYLKQKLAEQESPAIEAEGNGHSAEHDQDAAAE